MGAWLCQDLIWSKKFVGEFLGRLSHMKELGLNIDLPADLDFQSSIELWQCAAEVVGAAHQG